MGSCYRLQEEYSGQRRVNNQRFMIMWTSSSQFWILGMLKERTYTARLYRWVSINWFNLGFGGIGGMFIYREHAFSIFKLSQPRVTSTITAIAWYWGYSGEKSFYEVMRDPIIREHLTNNPFLKRFCLGQLWVHDQAVQIPFGDDSKKSNALFRGSDRSLAMTGNCVPCLLILNTSATSFATN